MNNTKRIYSLITILVCTLSLQAQLHPDSVNNNITCYLNTINAMDIDAATSYATTWVENIPNEEFPQYITCAERTLYVPYSNIGQRLLYRAMLQRLLQDDSDDITLLRYRYQYELLCNNNEGDRATDFTFYDTNNKEHNLSEYNGAPTVIIFNDPECEECAMLRQHITTQGECGGIKIDNTTTILVIYPDYPTDTWYKSVSHYPSHWITGYSEDVSDYYDLRTLPAIYILDSEHNVIQRNCHTHIIGIE